MMMAMSNLLGLLGLQPPTSNLSVNVTLALMMFLLIQYNGIRKGGLLARMKELTEPMFFLTPLNIIGELALHCRCVCSAIFWQARSSWRLFTT